MVADRPAATSRRTPRRRPAGHRLAAAAPRSATSTSPSRITNRPWPASPSRIITVPGSTSWPSKRLSRSICCWWSNGLNSGDVASRFLSRRSRAKRSSRSASAGTSANRRAIAARLTSRRSASPTTRRTRVRGCSVTSAISPNSDPSWRRPRSTAVLPGAREHPHLAGGDEVERGAQLALPDHHVAVAGADQAQRLQRGREKLPRQLGEERDGQELLRVLRGRPTDHGPIARPAGDRRRIAGGVGRIGAISASRSTGACRAANFASAFAPCA